MRNVENYKVVKAITMSLNDFKELVEKLTDGLATLATVEWEVSACIISTKKADETEEYWNEDMAVTLSEYFGEEVTGWHSDGCEEYPTIFICCKAE